MKKNTFLFTVLISSFYYFQTNAQTAMQLSGPDCNGINHDLFADLNSGKAVILHFFMPNCASCPPPAQKIQTMANNILANHPGVITAYAMPFNNTTTCAATASWVTSNNLSLYMPYDSGAIQVAHYGGFGMPTIVLLGGANHRVMFSTKSFNTSDTTEMRDSILALIGALPGTGVANLPSDIQSVKLYPNPTNTSSTVQLELKEATNLKIQLMDVTGKIVSTILTASNATGKISKEINTSNLPAGIYVVKILANGVTSKQTLSIVH